MGSNNIISFAVDQGWWDPQGNQPFNIFQVYGNTEDGRTARDGGFKYMSQAALEQALLDMVPVTEADLMQRVRDPRIADDEAGYGQVVSLHDWEDADLLRIWVAPTSSVAAPFVPWYLGVTSIPPEYGEHRYLTTGASSSFLNPDFQLQEASEFAGRVFKRVLYYMCSSPQRFLPLVTEILTAFEAQSEADVVGWVDRAATTLIQQGQREEARSLLAHYSHTRAAQALSIGSLLASSLDGYIKLAGLWKSPKGDQINDAGEGAETVNCLVGFDPDLPPDKQKIL